MQTLSKLIFGAIFLFTAAMCMFMLLAGSDGHVTFSTHVADRFGSYRWDQPLVMLAAIASIFAFLLFARVIPFTSPGWKYNVSVMIEQTGLATVMMPVPVLVLWLFNRDHSPDVNVWPVFLFFVLVASAEIFAFFDMRKQLGLMGRERVAVPTGSVATNDHEQPRDVARKAVPKIKLADLYGNEDIKRRLAEAGRAITARKADGKDPRNGILLHGGPGNGKTVFAEALAGELGLPLFTLSYSDVASGFVGVKSERVKAAFDQAMRNQPCVLFVDEIDSFIPDRTNTATQTKEDTDVVNALLTLLVDIRKHKVLVMAATNYIDRLDGAAIREGRFDFKDEITPPDETARIGLLQKGLKDNLPGVKVTPETVASVAQRWNGFSVKRILAVTEELPSYLDDLAREGARKKEVGFDDFMAALRRLQGRAAALPENAKSLSELILPDETREALESIANRVGDPLRVESLGGTLPTGVLFYGPPGTGKTTACVALAKRAGSAFLSTTGADLARDVKALEKLYAKAMELRPAIIFIDEADALLRSREYSPNPDATDKLLTLMDGGAGKVKDVMWVAATNHPDQIDAALLRGGRFTEKVQFFKPDDTQLSAHIEKWIKTRKIALDEGLTIDDVAGMLGSESIANAEAVMQYAVNRSIGRATGNSVVVGEKDLRVALSTVLGV